MHDQHDVFIDSIHTKKKLKIRFYSEDDGDYIERVCAPMDYAAGKRINDGIPRYWVWGFGTLRVIKSTTPYHYERNVSSICSTMGNLLILKILLLGLQRGL
ncbi:hypothetical protein WCU73_06060 [Pectobacterium brasiliense]|uniref:hypothetical protein n=1 Tax=Pectobacterium brasiliense TaxID=180957 RepID=UPI003019DFAB